jgi:hypothetical protein
MQLLLLASDYWLHDVMLLRHGKTLVIWLRDFKKEIIFLVLKTRRNVVTHKHDASPDGAISERKFFASLRDMLLGSDALTFSW